MICSPLCGLAYLTQVLSAVVVLPFAGPGDRIAPTYPLVNPSPKKHSRTQQRAAGRSSLVPRGAPRPQVRKRKPCHYYLLLLPYRPLRCPGLLLESESHFSPPCRRAVPRLLQHTPSLLVHEHPPTPASLWLLAVSVHVTSLNIHPRTPDSKGFRFGACCCRSCLTRLACGSLAPFVWSGPAFRLSPLPKRSSTTSEHSHANPPTLHGPKI